jgi:hypothetical protein
MDRIEQHVCIERLRKERCRSRGQSLSAPAIVGVRRKKNRWNEPTVRPQLFLQLEAVHAGHPHVQNQACNRLPIHAPQKLLGRGEEQDDESDGP